MSDDNKEQETYESEAEAPLTEEELKTGKRRERRQERRKRRHPKDEPPKE
jgi:hypothetical protein